MNARSAATNAKKETMNLKKYENFVADVLAVIAASFIIAYPTMWAWNYAMTRIFGLPTVGLIDVICLYWIVSVAYGTRAKGK